MAASSQPDVLMEERHDELMIPPTGGNPTQRTAHFLNPALHSIPSPPSSEFITISYSKKTHLKSLFLSHRPPSDKWKTWVDRLQPMYQHVWNQAGIYHSILSSTQRIPKDNILIMGLAERWCVKSNTFIFPWGEATFTLEDMALLGGYSVLGDSVLCPLKTEESDEIRSSLEKAQKEIKINGTRGVSHQSWIDYFMETDNKFEHQAFLVYWLSRFVLTKKNYYIARDLFSVAIHLSNGTQIALAPAVLASIYRDLRLLKELIIELSEPGATDCKNMLKKTSLSSPVQLLLLWTWKRFSGEPRLGRWQGGRNWDVVNVREALNLAEECFLWRPYAFDSSKSMFSKLYKENGEWVLVESNIDQELEWYAKCLRVSELVGLDCIEQYLPNRVAMQFGFDQDIPGYVTRSNGSYDDAWSNYNRPLRDVKLYVPPRLFEADVTMRYLKWYKGSAAIEDSFKGFNISRKKRSANHKTINRASWGGKINAPLLLLPTSLPTSDREEGGVCIDDEDKMSIKELVQCKRQSNTLSNTSADAVCVGAEIVKISQFPNSSSLMAGDGDFQQEKFVMEPRNMNTELVGRPKNRMEEANLSEKKDTLVSNIRDEDKGSWDGTIYKLPETELDARVSRLERLVAALKAAKHEGKLRIVCE